MVQVYKVEQLTRRSSPLAARGILYRSVADDPCFERSIPGGEIRLNLSGLQRFSSQCGTSPMDDQYPSTDDHQSVHLNYQYPDVERDLNRWLPADPVAACDSTLHCAVLPRHRGDNCASSSPGFRSCSPAALPTWDVRLRRGSVPLEQPGSGVRRILVTDRYPHLT